MFCAQVSLKKQWLYNSCTIYVNQQTFSFFGLIHFCAQSIQFSIYFSDESFNQPKVAPIMPNIGYTLDGYDIFYGNPIATGTEGATPDPGFRLQPIFKAVYSGKVTPDQRYSVPDGMEIRSCSGTCSMTFGSNLVSGTYVFLESTLLQ